MVDNVVEAGFLRMIGTSLRWRYYTHYYYNFYRALNNWVYEFYLHGRHKIDDTRAILDKLLEFVTFLLIQLSPSLERLV